MNLQDTDPRILWRPDDQEADDQGADVRASGFARLDDAPFPDFTPGHIWLVGAGPGAAGLLTLMGYHALTRADVIVYDALVGPDILRWAPPGTPLEYAGKRGGKRSATQADITLRLLDLARAGRRVLRLKGGDPFVFGRGGEECEALAKAGVPFRIVPGISAGVGGLAYAGIPTTHRVTNHSVTFLTGHDASGGLPASVDWPGLARSSPVIVMYMAVRNLAEIAAKLLDAGRDPTDPVAVVARATLESQTVIETRLGAAGSLAEAGDLPTPAIVVIGPVVNLRDRLHWFKDGLEAGPLG